MRAKLYRAYYKLRVRSVDLSCASTRMNHVSRARAIRRRFCRIRSPLSNITNRLEIKTELMIKLDLFVDFDQNDAKRTPPRSENIDMQSCLVIIFPRLSPACDAHLYCVIHRECKVRHGRSHAR